MTTTQTNPWEGSDVISQAVKDLAVELTDEEALQRGRSACLQSRAVGQLEADQKLVLTAMKQKQKADMAAARAELTRLTEAVNDGKEARPVTCVVLADFETGICTTMRTDTCETVETRRLTADEKQLNIPAATPLRVVRDDKTGRLRRDDGRELDTMPFVRAEHCAPQRCRECEEDLGRLHGDDCDRRGMGTASVVTTDDCDDRACLECNAGLGERHKDGCQHVSE